MNCSSRLSVTMGVSAAIVSVVHKPPLDDDECEASSELLPVSWIVCESVVNCSSSVEFIVTVVLSDQGCHLICSPHLHYYIYILV